MYRSHLQIVTFLFIIFAILQIFQQVQAQVASGITNLQRAEFFLQDEANLVKEPIRSQIIAACQEIEQNLRIRIVVRTEFLDSLDLYSQRVENFFLSLVRDSSIDKRIILLFAGLTKDSLQGRVTLRVGIGLKYLITKEMGQRILDRVILPNNAENNDGKAFLEGILAIKSMLLDEFKREQLKQTHTPESFSLLGLFWRSKEIWLVILIVAFLFYLVFFVERCPRCNGNLKISTEVLKEPGVNTFGLQRKIYACTRCGFARRRKEPLYPPGIKGWKMWLTGKRRFSNQIASSSKLPTDFSAESRHPPS